MQSRSLPVLCGSSILSRDRIDASLPVVRSVAKMVANSAKARCVATRFGPSIDVRHRGVLKPLPHSRVAVAASQQLAVVRLWNGDCCRELSVLDARAFAAELIAAAAYAEQQNMLILPSDAGSVE